MAVSMSVVMRRTGGSFAARESDVTVTATVTTTGASYNNNQCSGRIRIWGLGGMGGTPILDQTFTHAIPANSSTVIVTKTATISQPNGVGGWVYAEVTFATGISVGTLTKRASAELPAMTTGYNSVQITDAATEGFNFLDDTYHVMVTKASDVSWYKVYVWAFGTMPRGGRVIAEKASGNPGTFEWTPTTEQYAPYLTDDVETDCVIVADFYNASGSVVTSRQATVRLKVPLSVVPTIASPAIVDSSGAFGRFGAYVSSKSGIRATASTAGVYGSTVTRAELALGNTSHVATSGLSSLSIDAGTLSSAEGVAASLSVKDSRGRTATHSFGTLPVVGYSTPTVAGTTARRVDPSTGAESDTSTTVRVSLTAHTDDINGKGLNAGTLRIYHRQRGAEDWTTDKTLTAENGKFSQDVDVTGISDAYAWEFRVELTDWFGVTSTADYAINTATPLVDFRNNGKGVALLGIANKDCIILNDDTDVNGGLFPYGGIGFIGKVGDQDGTGSEWFKLGTYNSSNDQGNVAIIEVYFGDGQNANGNTENSKAEIYIKDSYDPDGAFGVLVNLRNCTSDEVVVKVLANSYSECDVWIRPVYAWDRGHYLVMLSGTWTPGDSTSAQAEPSYGMEQKVYYHTDVFVDESGNANIDGDLNVNTIRSSGSIIGNAIYIRNSNYIMGYLSGNSNATRLLGMNSSNEVELNWTSGGLKGRVMKQIWSGSWITGSINVPEIVYYNVIVVACNSAVTEFGIGVRQPGGNRFIVWSMNPRGDPGFTMDSAAITMNGYTLTKSTNFHLILINNTFSGWGANQGGIYRIWGVL